ncbi:MAG TPA: hypothetical protein VHW72_22260, partial [Candidatus Angelobacter sp.]|nr:hypothetical protein [Candidatus Angelobacter sp.]
LPCDEYIPKEIAVRNYFQYGQPKEYTLNGLKYMIQLQQNRVAYNKIVQKIGEQIVKAAKEKLDPLPQPLDMELVPAAFAQPEPAVAQASEPAREGPNTVRFVYVVGTQREFQKYKVRSTLTPYADDLRPFWAPFPPPEGKESLRNAIGITTMGFVTEIKRMLPLTLDLDQNLIVEIRQAKEKNSLVVLLIDTWSLKIQPYQDLMRIYDDTNFLNCAALVIWDGSDETGKSAKDLESLVARIFDDNYKTRLPRLFMPKVATLNDFLTNIDLVLETLRSNVMTTGEPMNPLPPGGRELPRIRNG